MTRQGYSTLTAILLAGLIAGTIDIGAATLINGIDPRRILQFIASGLLGKGVLQLGTEGIVLGMVLQWAMSIIIAAIFVIASGGLSVLRRYWVGSGIAYGVVVFFVMNYVVVPLSMVHRVPQFNARGFTLNMLAMLLFGLIVAYFASRVRSVPAET